MSDYIGLATYSPEDNKLRLYPDSRLDAETYQRVKAAGFSWAPKQKLFVAPMWTPGREDLLFELCGEIGDEDTSLVERAEVRAERFEDYSDKRRKDYHRAKEAVASIADNIPLGQPILVGHHSERHARKDAERIENGMRHAIKMWDTSEYWTRRAAGAIHHAKYKERPDVRARRIKTIEADKRKAEKDLKRHQLLWKFWRGELNNKKGERIKVTRESALYFCNYYETIIGHCFPLSQYPRQAPASQYEGSLSLWSALGGSDGPEHMVCTVEQAQEIALTSHAVAVEHYMRWITHYDNRLLYEKAMLEDQGASELLKPKPKKEQLPICNYRAPEGFIMIDNKWNRGEPEKYTQVEMTKDQYSAIPNDYRGCYEVEKSHRVRVCLGTYVPDIRKRAAGVGGTDGANISHRYYAVFLTDSKTHEKPEPVTKKAPEPPFVPLVASQHMGIHKSTDPESANAEALREALRTGVQVAVAPQLFPTPPEIAARMVELAEIEPGHTVLEPSAGTGNIAKAIREAEPMAHLDCVEINASLCRVLESQKFEVLQYDFLETVKPYCPDSAEGHDRIIMNPPFENAVDIKHIRHALAMLKPGGKLVALCANGPRQREAFMNEAIYWEDLPAGSFKEQGTGVNVALMVLAA